MVTFSEAVDSCLLKNYCTISGRATRAEYWWFQLFIWGLTLWIISPDFFALEGNHAFIFLGGIFYILMIIPNFCCTIRRLHDTGHSGWWLVGLSLFSCIPVLGFFGVFYLIVLLCSKSDESSNDYGYITESEVEVVDTKQVSLKPNIKNEGLTTVKIEDKYGYIDINEKMVIEPRFDFAYDFSEGLAPVRIGTEEDGRWGYIDKTGNMVIEPQFLEVKGFSEGLAAVKTGERDKKNDKWGFIDKTGQFVIAPQFENTYHFANGVAVVKSEGNTWYIDKTGKRV